MWTNKEVLLISIASALAACFATFYAQKRFTSYIEDKVNKKTENPMLGFMNPDISYSSIKTPNMNITPTQNQQSNQHVKEVRYHQAPPGSGNKWTPLPIN